jgi:hypothetical protein
MNQVLTWLLGGPRKEWNFEDEKASEVGECNNIMNVKGEYIYYVVDYVCYEWSARHSVQTDPSQGA